MCKRTWPSKAPWLVAFWLDTSPWICGQRKRVAHTSTGTTQEENWSYLKGKPTRLREHIT